MSQRYIVNLFAAASGTSSVTVQKSGKLKQITIGLAQIVDANDDQICIVASQDGVNPAPLTSNLAQQTRILGMLSVHNGITTSGQDRNGQSINIPCNEPVGQGETLYVHMDRTGTATAHAWAIFWVD